MIAPRYLRDLGLAVAACLALLMGCVWVIEPYGVSPIRLTIPHVNAMKPNRINIDRLIKPATIEETLGALKRDLETWTGQNQTFATAFESGREFYCVDDESCKRLGFRDGALAKVHGQLDGSNLTVDGCAYALVDGIGGAIESAVSPRIGVLSVYGWAADTRVLGGAPAKAIVAVVDGRVVRVVEPSTSRGDIAAGFGAAITRSSFKMILPVPGGGATVKPTAVFFALTADYHAVPLTNARTTPVGNLVQMPMPGLAGLAKAALIR